MANPILQRELVATLRSPRAAWSLLAVVGLLMAVVLALWPSDGVYSLGEQASHALLNSISLGGLALALLVAPAFTATCLTSEKERGSYDLLTHTLLRPWQIAWGKVVSAQCYLLLLALAVLPILASTFFLGGVGARQVALIFAVMVTATVATGLVGFAVSAWSRQSFTALVITYSLALGWNTLPLLPALLLRSLVAQFPILGTAACGSPLAAMLGLVEPDLFLKMSLPVDPRWALPIYFGTCGAIAAACWFAGTIRILAPHLFERKNSAKDARAGAALRFPYVLIDPRRRKRLIGNWSNVMLAKELRSKTFGQAPWLIRGMYATFTLSLLLVGLMVQGGATLQLDVLKLAMIAFQTLVVVLLTPALLAGSVTQEVEQRQFDLLRQTLLSPHGFLTGKTVSAWLLVILLLIASVPMWWMMAYLENYQWVSTLVSLAVIGATLFLASAISLMATMLGRTTAVATALAFALVSLLAFGTLIPLLMGATLSANWSFAILSWNPFAAGLQAVSSELLKDHAPFWKAFLIHTIAAGAAFFFIAWLLLWRKLQRER